MKIAGYMALQSSADKQKAEFWNTSKSFISLEIA
jgi:hypothetical protein